MDKPHLEIARKLREAGFTAGYASDLSREVRIPGLELALRIYDATGVKLGPLKGKDTRLIRSALQLMVDAA